MRAYLDRAEQLFCRRTRRKKATRWVWGATQAGAATVWPVEGSRVSVSRKGRAWLLTAAQGRDLSNADWTEGLDTSPPDIRPSLSLETTVVLSVQPASFWFCFMVMTDTQWNHGHFLGTVDVRASRTTTSTNNNNKQKLYQGRICSNIKIYAEAWFFRGVWYQFNRTAQWYSIESSEAEFRACVKRAYEKWSEKVTLLRKALVIPKVAFSHYSALFLVFTASITIHK